MSCDDTICADYDVWNTLSQSSCLFLNNTTSSTVSVVAAGKQRTSWVMYVLFRPPGLDYVYTEGLYVLPSGDIYFLSVSELPPKLHFPYSKFLHNIQTEKQHERSYFWFPSLPLKCPIKRTGLKPKKFVQIQKCRLSLNEICGTYIIHFCYCLFQPRWISSNWSNILSSNCLVLLIWELLCFPDSQKHAVVIPRLKRPGLDRHHRYDKLQTGVAGDVHIKGRRTCCGQTNGSVFDS